MFQSADVAILCPGPLKSSAKVFAQTFPVGAGGRNWPDDEGTLGVGFVELVVVVPAEAGGGAAFRRQAFPFG